MTAPVLQVDGLSVTFPGRRGLFRRGAPAVRAVRDVTLEVGAGETLGLVGESGSGKTTLGRAVLRFVVPSGGSVRVAGPAGEVFDSRELGRRTPGDYRRAVQMVFQDPLGSLNPAMRVADIVGEPVQIHDGLAGAARANRTAELLGQVGLAVELLWRYPYELSGGQRQRVAIARALAARPRLIVLDEPVSALDVSTQSQVVNLLERIQRDTGTAYLLVAHDLAVVRHTSHRIAVMYHGRLVETGPADAVCDAPCHPYTALLVASIPDPDPAVQGPRRQHRRALTGGVAGAASVPADGCTYAPRCPWAMDVCRHEPPAVRPTAAGGTVACHLHTTGDPAAPLDLATHRTPSRSTA